MKIDLRNNKDFFAGLLFLVVGLTAVTVALRNYPLGTSLNMGPGYFPVLMGSILAAFGLFIMVRGLIKGEKIAGVWGIRPLILLNLGVVTFGFIIDRFGMIPALVALFFISALGGKEFKFKEVLILTLLMSAASWAIFIYGLNVPLRLFIWES
jgi:Tripartite tricarboxylate transporter TctB family.